MSQPDPIEQMIARLCARIDSGEIREAPLGPLFTPPAHMDRKSVRYRSVVRDSLGRAADVYEDPSGAKRMADAYNRVSEHFAEHRAQGRERA